jgi:sigma-B regulation protein RsbU (phosphoserine phosphatase)
MGFNMHGLAFKQSMMTLVGFSIVFATLFGVLSFKVQSELSTVLTEKGEEISLANVAIIENLFEKGKKLGDEYAEVLGKEMLAGKDLDDFLTQAVFDARQTLPQVLAVVVAYEPGMAPKAKWHQEVMRLAQYSGNEIKLMKGKDYFEKTWYKSTKNLQKGLWQEPFVGDFIKEPIAIYTAPIYQKDAYGNTVFAGVLCVDMSIAFLKETVASIPVSNSGYVVVLSANNTIIAHPKNEIVFKENLSDLSVGMGSQTVTEFEKTVQSMKKGLFMGTTADGKDAVIYFKAMESNGWTFMIVWPASEFMESQRSLEKMFAWMCFAGYVVMLLLIFVISTRVSRPLKELAVAANKMGQGDFDVAIPHLSGRDEIAQFAWAFLNMRTSLKEHMEKQKDLDRIESELDFAKDIQIGFLSMDEKEEGSEDPYHELTPFLLPAKEVGGDFYDFFMVDDDHIAVVMADVSGKGVPAALFMVISKTLIKMRTLQGGLPGEILADVNDQLCEGNEAELFVTVWLGVLELSTGNLTAVNAGHEYPAVKRADGRFEVIKTKHSLFIGGMDDVTYKEYELNLKPGDKIFVYTDGLPEATDSAGEMLGMDRMTDALNEYLDEKPRPLIEGTRESVNKFVKDAEQYDDITMMCLEYAGKK